jgi:hypothetical protein
MFAISDEMKVFCIVPSFLDVFYFGALRPFGFFVSS